MSGPEEYGARLETPNLATHDAIVVCAYECPDSYLANHEQLVELLELILNADLDLATHRTPGMCEATKKARARLHAIREQWEALR